MGPVLFEKETVLRNFISDCLIVKTSSNFIWVVSGPISWTINDFQQLTWLWNFLSILFRESVIQYQRVSDTIHEYRFNRRCPWNAAPIMTTTSVDHRDWSLRILCSVHVLVVTTSSHLSWRCSFHEYDLHWVSRKHSWTHDEFDVSGRISNTIVSDCSGTIFLFEVLKSTGYSIISLSSLFSTYSNFDYRIRSVLDSSTFARWISLHLEESQWRATFSAKRNHTLLWSISLNLCGKSSFFQELDKQLRQTDCVVFFFHLTASYPRITSRVQETAHLATSWCSVTVLQYISVDDANKFIDVSVSDSRSCVLSWFYSDSITTSHSFLQTQSRQKHEIFLSLQKIRSTSILKSKQRLFPMCVTEH